MILYLHGADSVIDLSDINDLYEREYEHCDMLRVFKSEMQHYRLVTHIIIDSEAVDSGTWEAAAELLYMVRPVPVLFLTENPLMADIYQKRQHYDVLDRTHENVHKNIVKWLHNELICEPVPAASGKEKQQWKVDMEKYRFLLGGMFLVLIVLTVTVGILLFRIRQLPEALDGTVRTEQYKSTDAKSIIHRRRLIEVMKNVPVSEPEEASEEQELIPFPKESDIGPESSAGQITEPTEGAAAEEIPEGIETGVPPEPDTEGIDETVQGDGEDAGLELLQQ